MKKINLIFLILLLISLAGCQSIQKSLVPQKKTGATEFLVKKKSPLVMPPSYGELPIPKSQETKAETTEEINIKSLINSKTKNTKTSDNKIKSKSSIEELVLKKLNNK